MESIPPIYISNISDKHWLVRAARRLPNETINTIDTYFQKRWETLLAVDELVVTLVGVLNDTQSLENTYIIYLG